MKGFKFMGTAGVCGLRDRRFEFKDSMLGLNLSGKKFNICVNEKLFVLCGKIRREAAKRLEVLYGGGAGAEDAVSGVCDFLENSIDDILGGGAAAEIFGAREMTVIPLTDLLVYIVDEITKKLESDLGGGR